MKLEIVLDLHMREGRSKIDCSIDFLSSWQYFCLSAICNEFSLPLLLFFFPIRIFEQTLPPLSVPLAALCARAPPDGGELVDAAALERRVVGRLALARRVAPLAVRARQN